MTLLSFSTSNILSFPSFIQQPYSSTKILINKNTLFFPVCLASPKQQKTSTPVKKNTNINTNSSSSTKRVPKNNNSSKNNISNDDDGSVNKTKRVHKNSSNKKSCNKNSCSKNNSDEEENKRYIRPPIPNAPAGFVIDGQGNVLIVSNKRIATIVDPSNNFPLECIIRRVFTSSRGDDCMLLCPVDMPVQILKSTNVEGWSAVSDDEVEAILPNAAYALAKIHIHLVHSGFCYTARGGFCYTEDDIFEFRTDDGQDVDGLPTEGIEITCFHLDGSHYMVYTPSDPLLFVVVKDQNSQLQIVDDTFETVKQKRDKLAALNSELKRTRQQVQSRETDLNQLPVEEGAFGLD